VSLIPPLANSFVRATLEGLQHSLAKLVVKNEPVTVEMLEAIFQDAQRSGSLLDLHLATACLLDFPGFLKFSKLTDFRPCDFSIIEDMMKIRIVRSKTDQLQQGDKLMVARTRTPTCLVTLLECYMCRTGMSLED